MGEGRAKPQGFGTEVPKQRGVAVVANYLPEENLHLTLQEAENLQPTTVGGVLAALRQRLGGSLTWTYHGQCLAVHDGNFLLTEASAPPAELVGDLQAQCAAGQPVPLEEIAGRMSHLNTLQWEALNQALPQLALALNWDLRLYGLLTPHQRAAAATEKGLPLAGLSPAVQLAALRYSKRTHPWFTAADLKAALLRIVPCTLAVGSKGISFWIEYHHPDSPRDRDLIFTLPLELPTAAQQW